MVCLQCTFVVSQAHWTFYRYNLSLNVVFLFQSFLVITVTAIYIYLILTYNMSLNKEPRN